MAIRNPFDQVILDDPAYAEETKIDPQAGKKLVRDIYGLAVGQEDPFANQRLLRELSVGLAQREAGLPVDPNKSFVTSAERQDPVLGPALNKFNFQPMGPLEAGERTVEFLLRDQKNARDKQLRGEELTFGEKILASPFMAAIDALDVLGVSALAKRGVIKASEQGLKFLDNLIQSGASKEDIAKQFVEKFPQDANNVGLSYYKSFSDENPRVVFQKDDGTGAGSSTIKIPKTYQDRIDKNLKGSEATQLKVKKALEENPNQAPKAISQFAKDYGMENYKDLLTEIYKRQAAGTLPANYRLEQALPGEIAGTKVAGLGTKKAAQLSAEKFGPILEQANQLYASNPQKYKDQGVSYFIQDFLFKNPQVDDISDDFLLKNFQNYQDLKTPGMKQKGSGNVSKNNQKFLTSTMNKFGIYGSERAASRDNYTILFHSFRHDPKEIEAALKSNGALTKKEFAAQNSNLTTKEVAEQYQTYAANVGQKTVDDELTQYIAVEEPQNLENFKSKIGTRDEFNSWVRGAIDDFFFDPNMPNEKAAFIEKYKNNLEEATGKKIKNDNDFRKKLFNIYKADLSHSYPIRSLRKEIPGGAAFADLIKVNFSGLNLGLQAQADGYLRKNIPLIKKLLKQDGGKLSDKSRDEVEKIVERIRDFNEEFENRLMTSYAKIDDPEVAKILSDYFPDNRVGFETLVDIDDFEGGVFKKTIKSDFLLGVPSKQEPTIDELKDYFNNHLSRALTGDSEPLFNKKTGSGDGPLAGITSKIRPGTPDTSFFKQGGPVRMAIGGDPLENINQQQFTPDPAMNEDFFKKAVDSGNLQAFGAGNLFKIFGKVPGLLTPKKVVSDIPTAPGTTPMVPNVDPGDFPFKSYFIESTTNPKAPKSALPKDWLKYYTGNIGVPQSEMKDAGIFNYLEDIEKFFPNTKLTQQNLVDVYESSPIANIEVKIKRQPATNTPPGSLGSYMGKPTHQGSGSQPLDSQGTNYREIVVNVDKLPGQDKPFFNASHFGKDPNVIAFTRVADYKDVDGNTVAAIQEIQTDMLTNLKKEQERMKATAVMIRNYKENLKNRISQGDIYMQDMLEKTEREYPESMLKFMETSDLVRPNNPTFADTLTPDVVKDLNELQERITTIANQNRVTVVDPDFQNKIVALQEEGRQKFNKLFELNRGTNYEDQLKNIKILDVDNTDDLERFANANPSYEARFRPVQSFPVLPFNKGKDYIDLLLKATIQDAQANGINKVAIYPSELVNKRWGKDPDGPAAKKFKTIYDNITVQEMKNIAKKYTGSKNNLKIEEIVDKSKADKGLKFYNKNVDGELELLKDFEPRSSNSPDEVQDFLDAEIERVASDFGSNEVVIRREIAPGQTMEYYVQLEGDDGFKLVPLGDADRAENATVIIDEYNPQRVKMFTLTLPEETTKKGPMFIYGKKDGGKIASDGLVSITDIFGEY